MYVCIHAARPRDHGSDETRQLNLSCEKVVKCCIEFIFGQNWFFISLLFFCKTSDSCCCSCCCVKVGRPNVHAASRTIGHAGVDSSS